MDYIHLSACKFRLPLPAHSSTQHEKDPPLELLKIPMNKRIFTNEIRDKHPDLFWPFAVSRRATSTLELDVFEADILNPRMNQVGTAPGENSGFVNRTLEILWQEERLRTGVLPPRIIPKPRDVIAGAHLSPVDMRERLDEVLYGRLNTEKEVDQDGDDNIGHNQFNGESENGDGSQNIPLSDVLNYLDSSILMCDDDADEEPNEVIHVDGDDGHDDDEDEFDDKPMSIEQTWRDIAECTQAVKKKRDRSTKQQAHDKPRNEVEPSMMHPSPPPETPRTPYTPRTPRTRTPSQSQPPSRSQSQQHDQPEVQTIRRGNRPPSKTDLGPEPLDAWNIEWGTPFYSSVADMRSASIRPFGYGGTDVRIRDAGALGFPPFPLPFGTHSSKDRVAIPVSLVTPACKPPTLSQLRNAADVRGNWGSGAAGKGGDGQRIGIDSAGRMVGIREASATKGLSLTPPLLSAIAGDSLSLEDADELVQWKHSDPHNDDVEDGASSFDVDEISAILRISRTLRQDQHVKEGIEHEKNDSNRNHDGENEEGNSLVLSNQFLSPKYDETFQFSVKQASGSKFITLFFFGKASKVTCSEKLTRFIFHFAR